VLDVKYRVLSEPATVWWAGFRSDTFKLQQAGWELAAEEDVHYGRLRLLLRHQNMRLYALTSGVEYDYYRSRHPGRGGLPLEFHVVMASPHFQVQRVGNVNFEAMRQIDAKPQYVETEIKSLEDFKIFATPLTRTEEIIVEPATVAAMLEKIREMQAPEQARLREKHRLLDGHEQRMSDVAPQQRFHAQIISIADHRLAAA
jgi:hypothetical protein